MDDRSSISEVLVLLTGCRHDRWYAKKLFLIEVEEFDIFLALDIQTKI